VRADELTASTEFAVYTAVERILLVVRGPHDAASVRRQCEELSADLYEVAVCLELAEATVALVEAVHAQRAMTAALREALGSRAENIAVLVACQREGEAVKDCARDWGANRCLRIG
jgi:hypothetical protein